MVLALQAAGLFYFLAAFLAIRAAATGGMIDAILGALSPADPAEAKAQTFRRRWLTWGAVLNGWGGAAMAALLHGRLVPVALLIVPFQVATIATGVVLAGYALKAGRQARFG